MSTVEAYRNFIEGVIENNNIDFLIKNNQFEKRNAFMFPNIISRYSRFLTISDSERDMVVCEDWKGFVSNNGLSLYDLMDKVKYNQGILIVDIIKTVDEDNNRKIYFLKMKSIDDIDREDFKEVMENMFNIDLSNDQEYKDYIIHNYLTLISNSNAEIFETDEDDKLFLDLMKTKIMEQDEDTISNIISAIYNMRRLLPRGIKILDELLQYINGSYRLKPLDSKSKVDYILKTNVVYVKDVSNNIRTDNDTTYNLLKLLCALDIFDKEKIITPIDNLFNTGCEIEGSNVLDELASMFFLSNNMKKEKSPKVTLCKNMIGTKLNYYAKQETNLSENESIIANHIYGELLKMGVMDTKTFNTVFSYLGSLTVPKCLNRFFVYYLTETFKADLEDLGKNNDIDKYYEILYNNFKCLFKYFAVYSNLALALYGSDSKIYKKLILTERLKNGDFK